MIVDRRDLVLDAMAAPHGRGRLKRQEQSCDDGTAHNQWAALTVAAPAGWESIQWKYLMYCLISASLRPWLGIGILLYSFSIALASASVSGVLSGSFIHLNSQASLRRLVTPATSGPSFLPWPTEWQARHLLSKLSLACTVPGSVGAAEAGRL